jgi:hypothetical protein
MQVHQLFSLLGGWLEAFHLPGEVQKKGTVAAVPSRVTL